MSNNLYSILSSSRQPTDVNRQNYFNTQRATGIQKNNLTRMLEEQRKRLMREFKEQSDLGGLGDILDVVSVFTGPVGAAISQGLKSVGEMSKIQSSAKGHRQNLLKGTSKFKNTFLKDEVDKLMKESKGLKMGGFDMFTKLATDVIGGFTRSSAGQGDKLGKSLIEGIKNPGEGKFWNQLKSSFNPKDYKARKDDVFKGKFKLGDDVFGSKFVNKIQGWKPMEKMEGIEAILKDFKGFGDGFDLDTLMDLYKREEKGSSVPYDSQWI